MTLIETILQGIQKITPEEIAVVMDQLEPVDADEVVIGVTWSDEARRLWTLAEHYEDAGLSIPRLNPLHQLEQGLREAYHRQVVEMLTFESLARDMAWAAMRVELHAWDCAVGLRANFTVVRSAPRIQARVITAAVASLDELFEQIFAFHKEKDEPGSSGAAN